ncbi:MAG TPA: hypothetical protein PK711_08765 [Bacteroidales bacterium]|nr:hypothetical protein [Bacteroidales bacterium]
MLQELAFLKNPFIRLLENAHHFFPGIERIVVVYYDRQAKDLVSVCAIPRMNPGQIDTVSLGENKVLIQKSRNSKSPTAWLTRQELPYDLKEIENKQVEIFDEQHKTVLVLRFPNKYDGLQDIMFLYFQESMNMFGINLNSRSLSTDYKSIIGYLTYHFILTCTRILETDAVAAQSIVESTKSVISSLIQSSEELSRTRQYYGQSLVDLCQNYLDEFQSDSGRRYRFHESAIGKIQKYAGEIKYLRTIIRKAVMFAEYLEKDAAAGLTYIHDWHLNAETYVPEQRKEEQYSYPEDRYTKTIYLLDRLETAAKEVVMLKKKLTGKNVGELCDRPISAAAITDALDKHKKKIIDLFEKYPEKWEIIRNDFRPVRNLAGKL